MAADCSAQVRKAFETKKSRSGLAASRSKVWDQAVHELVSLSPECSSELHRTAEHLLMTLPDADETDLWVAVQAAAARAQPEVLELLTRSVMHPATTLKEDYVSLLVDIGYENQAIRALIAALSAGSQPSERADTALIIRALHHLRAVDAAPAVRPYIRDNRALVRGLAVAFLYDFDTREAAPLFLERLGRETDPGILEQMTDALVMWEYTEGIPVLRQLADEATVGHAVQRAVGRALAELER